MSYNWNADWFKWKVIKIYYVCYCFQAPPVIVFSSACAGLAGQLSLLFKLTSTSNYFTHTHEMTNFCCSNIFNLIGLNLHQHLFTLFKSSMLFLFFNEHEWLFETSRIATHLQLHRIYINSFVLNWLDNTQSLLGKPSIVVGYVSWSI